jgi:propionyl-CoA carboxylase alpha chain
MFKRILIANRGEIACRIIKTARKLGIESVAVYSEADKDALHVEMADTAIAIGPPPAAESYLVIDKIVAACRQSGAEAVHPGYGFLSEREAFPKALAAAGVVFIGPNPKAIAAMGDKIESKKAAAAAKVSTVPGHLGVIQNEVEAIEIAEEIGYPVMIKASAACGSPTARPKSLKALRARVRKQNLPSATTVFSSRNLLPTRATSKSRCSATSTAMSSISASANARSSGETRR